MTERWRTRWGKCPHIWYDYGNDVGYFHVLDFNLFRALCAVVDYTPAIFSAPISFRYLDGEEELEGTYR